MNVKMIFSIIGLLVVGFLTFVWLKPSQMQIFREILVKATPEAIFPYINNSQKSNEWMPWKDMDAELIMTYSGPSEGVGSTSSWDSKGNMGTGQAVVIESILNKVVKTQLNYTKPMHITQLAEISLTPTVDGTLVRWLVTGENAYIGKLMCVFINMDKMLGGEFEKGLLLLKSKVESLRKD